MYSPIHASAGLLIAQLMPNPVAALASGIASHYLLDAIPHGDLRVGHWFMEKHTVLRLLIVEIFDLGIAILTIGWLVGQVDAAPLTLVAGALGGILPDLLWGGMFTLQGLGVPAKLLRPLQLHQRWHTFVHAKASYDVPFRVGLGYQIVLLIGLLAYYR